MKPYVITRSQYKKIKKLDHQEMSDFLENFIKNYMKNKVEQQQVIEFHKDCMSSALLNTKGIGVQKKKDFLQKYDEIVERRKSEIKGGYVEKEEINA